MTYPKALTAAAIALAVPAGAAFLVTAAPAPAVHAPGEPSQAAVSRPDSVSATQAPVPTVAGRATDEPVQVAPAPGSLAVDESRGEPEREPRLLGTFSDQGGTPEGFDVPDAPLVADPGRTAEPVVGADDLSAGPWCNVQCITKGVAYGHGTGVEIVVETSVQAQILVTVVRDVDGDDVPDLIGSANTPGLDTQLHWVLEDLEQGATYYGMATATDVYGNTSYAWGHFTMP